MKRRLCCPGMSASILVRESPLSRHSESVDQDGALDEYVRYMLAVVPVTHALLLDIVSVVHGCEGFVPLHPHTELVWS